MVSSEHIAALTEARRRMPRNDWQRLAARISASSTAITPASIRHCTEDLLNRDAAWVFSEAFTKNLTASWSEIAAAMSTVDYLIGDNSSSTEIIWTGPANGRFPVRRIDQVLYDLIASANTRIMLVTFAAHRVPHLCEHLTQAVLRGVDLTLIVESEGESEGQLTRDAMTAFQNVPNNGTQIYYWPLAKRERNLAGRPGKLHVKSALIDNTALIGSANLTDDAFNRNMELGLLVRDPTTVLNIANHFHDLIERGILIAINPSR